MSNDFLRINLNDQSHIRVYNYTKIITYLGLSRGGGQQGAFIWVLESLFGRMRKCHYQGDVTV